LEKSLPGLGKSLCARVWKDSADVAIRKKPENRKGLSGKSKGAKQNRIKPIEISRKKLWLSGSQEAK